MFTRRASRFILLPVLLVSVSLLITACGGSNSQTAGSDSESADGPTQEVKIVSGAFFEPAAVTVKAGTTVVWENTDPEGHQVHDDRNTFISEVLGQAGKFNQTYDAPGIYTYHCHVHGNMKGTVTVE